MLIIRDRDQLPEDARGGVYAIGNFDGVHRGHKALIGHAVAAAKGADARAGVIVFEPHPREFFHPEEPHFRLTPLDEKLVLLERLGIDIAAVLTFDAALSGLSAEAFIEQVLVSRLGVSQVVIGYDFCFGKKRGGSPETMKLAGLKAGFSTTVIPQQAEEGEIFSSTAIRLHLAQGDVAGAARLLGHSWRVSGTVSGGNRIGTELGFPTANIELGAGVALMHGIYAVRVEVGDAVLGGAAYFGGRPSVDGGPARLEVFLFDFDGDLYGRDLAVTFEAFVRGDKRFDSLEALKAQMARDCEQAKSLLAASKHIPRPDGSV